MTGFCEYKKNGMTNTNEYEKTRDLSQVNTVLFDFDGTLLDSNALIADCLRHTVKTLASRGISDEEIRSTFGELLADSMRRLMPDVEAEYALDFFRDYQREIFLDRISLFDGTEETLRVLKAAGYKTALVTSRMKGSTERALTFFGIGGFFDAVLTASDTEKFKPDPDPIFTILDMIGSRPGEAIYIGDTEHDIEAGRAAGVITVLVDWSLALPPGKRADTPAPDIIIHELGDIAKLLGIKNNGF